MVVADIDWATAGIGSVSSLVIGAIGQQVYRVLIARWTNQEQSKLIAVQQARQSKRDTVDELYRILDVMRTDRQEDRNLIHELRGELGLVKNRLAVCEFDRQRMHEDLEKAGISIRPSPPLNELPIDTGGL